MSSFAVNEPDDYASCLDRMRVRMGKLIRRDRRPPEQATPTGDPELASRPQPPPPDSAALAADLAALDRVVEECAELIAQAWGVAVILNRVRRSCSRCDEEGLVSEALGLHQGVLNKCQQQLRTAARTLGSMKASIGRGGNEGT